MTTGTRPRTDSGTRPRTDPGTRPRTDPGTRPRADRDTQTRTEASGQLIPPPPRLRRRPSLVVASALLVVLGALASAWAYSSLGNAREVVALRTDVARGRVITAESLQVVRIGVDPALRVVPASQAEALVGSRAAVDLKAGQLLVPAAVTSEVVPGPGRSAVGLALTAAQMPGERLLVGDEVRIVSTPGAQGDVGTDRPVVYRGQVLAVSDQAADGTTGVTVQVDADVAPDIAARSATGKVALVLDSRVR